MPVLPVGRREGSGEGGWGGGGVKPRAETWKERQSFQGYLDHVGRKPLPRALWHHAIFKVLAALLRRGTAFPVLILYGQGNPKSLAGY